MVGVRRMKAGIREGRTHRGHGRHAHDVKRPSLSREATPKRVEVLLEERAKLPKERGQRVEESLHYRGFFHTGTAR